MVPGIVSNTIFNTAATIVLAADTSKEFYSVYVGGAGILKVDMLDQAGAVLTVSFTCVAGTLLPIRVTKIYSTGNGTTATLIVGLN